MRVSTLGLLLLAACDPGDVVLVSPEKSGAEGPSLSVRAVVDTPYVPLAESLMWTTGVPGATVRVHKMVEPYDESYWVTAVADSTGVAAFFDLLAGLYEVEVSRTLDSTEIERVGGGVHVLAGGRRLYLPAEDVQEVTMAPDGRGALVFGEFALAFPGYIVTGMDAKYFELHNNADTTIYLDGKYWGVGWWYMRDFPNWGTCAEREVVRNDPEGIWTRVVFQFPGMGNDYPLDPGRTALIASVAIDHREVHPDLIDLSHADFEWRGGGAWTTPTCRTCRQSVWSLPSPTLRSGISPRSFPNRWTWEPCRGTSIRRREIRGSVSPERWFWTSGSELWIRARGSSIRIHGVLRPRTVTSSASPARRPPTPTPISPSPSNAAFSPCSRTAGRFSRTPTPAWWIS